MAKEDCHVPYVYEEMIWGVREDALEMSRHGGRNSATALCTVEVNADGEDVRSARDQNSRSCEEGDGV